MNYLQFMNLHIDDTLIKNESMSSSSDLLHHPLYIQTIQQLLADV